MTATAICGSDLHLYNAFIPSLMEGDILGHEFMGEVVELGSEVKNLKKGDRVVVPFTIACGQCFFCQKTMWSLCDNSNPNAGMAEKMYGFTPSGLFGFSHLLGGYAGGQAEYVRVPFADVGPYKVPEGLRDDQVLFLTDIFPTGYMAAENCNIQPGDTVAVWGCGPDSCIDAVGMEAHGMTLDNIYDKGMQMARIGTDRPHVLRQAIMSCRKGGTVSIPGVYGGLLNMLPIGAAHAKGLTFKMGQTHVHRYLPILMESIEKGRIDPSAIITHRVDLADAPAAYAMFKNKTDGCVKVVMTP